MPARSSDGGRDPLPPTLAAAVALVVAALAAVGVSGDLLARTVRNHPVAIAAVVVVALLAFAVPAVAASTGWAVRAAIVLVVVAACWAAAAGARAAGSDREQPRVSLTAATTASATTLTVDASANGLRSRDNMLVQVQGVTDWPADSADRDLQVACNSDRNARWPAGATPRWPGELVLWQQAGPDAKGAVTVGSKVELVPGEQEGVCVWVVLTNVKGQAPRRVVSYLQLPALRVPSAR
ncbi:hypothetical protein GCM10025868_00750 [Angustibacter aerolatus]|uniref:DUF4131 domain-containing protein n=1 Tax=Angustibacter aerolatus TaxID=1162965 RepID=A0ABQ6J9G9_9ACTN|nr:hypothetical protein GCM10025868_00750 [Angustibacter aerolatus]